ncbi:hypothetical protein HELRODRAFT_172674 [Helobdella robusta]|uniref:Uncharacterized protein n=1 Tax=Helobdella robusta TaxID=6412 RepID=T1F5R8_HELRO|nr:hypothetical protein HELRODRAFT_172674 [Helobdella robusta]ESO04314.1 hypothetical protein HELRODRAFT_172674 [Helobdella robusta]
MALRRNSALLSLPSSSALSIFKPILDPQTNTPACPEESPTNQATATHKVEMCEAVCAYNCHRDINCMHFRYCSAAIETQTVGCMPVMRVMLSSVSFIFQTVSVLRSYPKKDPKGYITCDGHGKCSRRMCSGVRIFDFDLQTCV